MTGLRAAAELEDKTQLASVTPGPLLPAREMLGELLLDQNRPREALHEFEASLQQEPNRFWSLYGTAEAAKRAGNAPLARQYFTRLLAVARLADQPGRTQLTEARQVIPPKP